MASYPRTLVLQLHLLVKNIYISLSKPNMNIAHKNNPHLSGVNNSVPCLRKDTFLHQLPGNCNWTSTYRNEKERKYQDTIKTFVDKRQTRVYRKMTCRHDISQNGILNTEQHKLHHKKGCLWISGRITSSCFTEGTRNKILVNSSFDRMTNIITYSP